ncbi:MAG: alpha/beta hydrolase fold domain-containing protein [Hymenobacter sp.]
MTSCALTSRAYRPPRSSPTEYDPLMSEGKLLADNLQKAGVPVKCQNYDGVTHEFFGMAAVVPEAEQAQALASGELKNALK